MIIIYDHIEDQYTAFYEGRGGPIVSAKTKVEVRTIYREAFQLADAVRKLLEFNEKGSWEIKNS